MMRKRLMVLVLVAWPSACRAAPPPEATVEVPVAPIASVTFGSWTNAFRLQNPSLEVVVVPEIGRVLYLGCKKGRNLLHANPSWTRPGPDEAAAPWANYGGIWLWPATQAQWEKLTGANWPPPEALADAPWTGSAWRAEDDSEYCLMTREFGAPLHIKVSRLVKLDPTNQLVSIRQRLERTAPSEVPVSIWTLTQVARPDQIILPVDEDTRLETGFKALLFDPPGDAALTRCPGALVYDTKKAGEHKLGTDSRRGWIAARKGDILLVQRLAGEEDPEAPPSEACIVEMYSNPDLGYAEIQTLSMEKNLHTGEALHQNVVIECMETEAGLAPCDLARVLREKLGDKIPP